MMVVSVVETESTHQLVIADHITMMMETVIAQFVLSDVMNVPLKTIVLLVPTKPDQLSQTVNVLQDSMNKTKLKNVHHVLTNVLLVLTSTIVKNVTKTELTHQPVTVWMDTMLLNTNVTYVLTNVSLVNPTNGTVLNVLKPDKKNHTVLVHQDIMITEWKTQSVTNVLLNVSLVQELLTIVTLVPETEFLQTSVHVQS
jgi:hypothetical protein